MFSIRQKREISDKIQKFLRDTNHPELPNDEIIFTIHVIGSDPVWSWAAIRINGAVTDTSSYIHTEFQDIK